MKHLETVPKNMGLRAAFLVVSLLMWMPALKARETMEAPRQVPAQAVRLTPEQEVWRNTGLEGRRTLGEQIGEQGGRNLAKEMGLEPLFDGITGKAIPQGPDQVYLGKNGRVSVFETKANSSPKNAGYGYVQGSIEHTLKSAEYVLKSTRASEVQKRAARAILKAAAQGKLDVYIVRTFHVQGKVTRTIIEQLVQGAEAHQALAKGIIASLEKSGISIRAKDTGKSTNGVSAKLSPARIGKKVGEGKMPGGGTNGSVKTAPAIPKAVPVAGKTGAGPAVQTVSSGVGNTVKTVAKSAGIGIAVDVGVRTYHGYQVEQEYKEGHITGNERMVAHGENIAGCVGGWGGAVVGAKGCATAGAALGSFFGPIGTGVGTVAGGIIGAVGGYMAGDAVASAGARGLLKENIPQ